MDPLSQGALGAAAPSSVAPRGQARIACLFGFLAGLAPDLDILISSSTDPLLYLMFHRQFTHALAFIPVGGFLCGWVLHHLLGKARGLSLRASVLCCTLGYATHALLDACTTYGTQLLWPFSNTRFAWNVVSVVDPLFTLPVLLLVGVGAWRRKALLARLALCWAVAYPALGLVQRERVEDYGWQLAQDRGHTPLRLEAKPSFGNLLLWKVVYETDAHFHVHAVRMGAAPRLHPGSAVARLDLERDFPWLDASSQQARDVERFRWFSKGYVAVDPRHPGRITDIRYSLLPNEIAGLWSIALSPTAAPNAHVGLVNSREVSADTWARFWAMLRSSDTLHQ